MSEAVEKKPAMEGGLFLPLRGVRVLELSQIMAGPTCGLMLADLGADVIKVEKMPGGDDTRRYRKVGDTGMPPSFVMLNRGKRSVCLDVRHPDGKAALLEMIAQADVLTENFRKGVMTRLGLDYESLRHVNPRLIHCSITGYGNTGPLSDKGGFDLILQAFSGLISVTGEAGRPPVKPGISLADVNAGILAAFGILAAYINRLRTGKGAKVDSSLLQASLQQLYWYAAAYFSSGAIGTPSGTAHTLIAPYQVYTCKDGGLALGGANQKNWERIAEVLGRPQWKTEARFETGAARLQNRGLLETLINDIMADDTVASWMARFEAAGVPCGPVQNVQQALEHPQSRAIGMVLAGTDHDGKPARALGLPVLFDGANGASYRPAPRLGEHGHEVLAEFGIAEARIDRLVRDGVLRTLPPPSGQA